MAKYNSERSCWERSIAMLRGLAIHDQLGLMSLHRPLNRRHSWMHAISRAGWSPAVFWFAYSEFKGRGLKIEAARPFFPLAPPRSPSSARSRGGIAGAGVPELAFQSYRRPARTGHAPRHSTIGWRHRIHVCARQFPPMSMRVMMAACLSLLPITHPIQNPQTPIPRPARRLRPRVRWRARGMRQ